MQKQPDCQPMWEQTLRMEINHRGAGTAQVHVRLNRLNRRAVEPVNSVGLLWRGAPRRNCSSDTRHLVHIRGYGYTIHSAHLWESFVTDSGHTHYLACAHFYQSSRNLRLSCLCILLIDCCLFSTFLHILPSTISLIDCFCPPSAYCSQLICISHMHCWRRFGNLG